MVEAVVNWHVSYCWGSYGKELILAGHLGVNDWRRRRILKRAYDLGSCDE